MGLKDLHVMIGFMFFLYLLNNGGEKMVEMTYRLDNGMLNLCNAND